LKVFTCFNFNSFACCFDFIIGLDILTVPTFGLFSNLSWCFVMSYGEFLLRDYYFGYSCIFTRMLARYSDPAIFRSPPPQPTLLGTLHQTIMRRCLKTFWNLCLIVEYIFQAFFRLPFTVLLILGCAVEYPKSYFVITAVPVLLTVCVLYSAFRKSLCTHKRCWKWCPWASIQAWTRLILFENTFCRSACEIFLMYAVIAVLNSSSMRGRS
jgi:hypothetical protein